MQTTKNTPSHNVYVLPPRDGDQKWILAGAGWQNRDGSVNLTLKTDVPRGTRLQLRVRKARSEDAPAADGAAAAGDQEAPANPALMAF